MGRVGAGSCSGKEKLGNKHLGLHVDRNSARFLQKKGGQEGVLLLLGPDFVFCGAPDPIPVDFSVPTPVPAASGAKSLQDGGSGTSWTCRGALQEQKPRKKNRKNPAGGTWVWGRGARGGICPFFLS